MSMKSLEMIRDMLCEELDEIAEKGELSAGNLDTVDKITHAMKNIDKIMDKEEEMQYSNSRYSRGMGDWTARGSYSRRGYSRRSMVDQERGRESTPPVYEGDYAYRMR